MAKTDLTKNKTEEFDLDLELFDEEDEYQVKGVAFGNKCRMKTKKETMTNIVKGITKIVKEAMK